MPRSDASCSMSSAEKKRVRDRRAQQNLRDKKLRHTTQLEERVAFCEQNHTDEKRCHTAQLEEKVAHCEQNHSDGGVQILLQVIEGLRKQNEALVSRQKQLCNLVQSWDGDSASTPAADTPGETDQHRHQKPLQLRQGTRVHIIGSSHSPGPSSTSTPPATTSAILPTSPVESVPCLTDAPWKLTPLNSDDFSRPTTTFAWFAYPERIAMSPDSPDPLDILYGTKDNPLASMIHARLRQRPLRDPEALALGWVMYHLSKWIISPSPATYARIPEYLKPVLAQIQRPHPITLDFMVWPQIRLNLMEGWHVYKNMTDDLFGLFTCCVKVRWPWGEKILERDERNKLCIRREFYDTFMKESGWGLTSEFIGRYPDVVAGVDVQSIIYEVV